MKGILLALVGLLVLGLWVVSAMLPSQSTSADPENLRRYAPAFLLTYCLVATLFSKGERGLYFSPAEVNLLFPGPFTRRQLLLYKITTSTLFILPTTLFLTFLLRIHAHWYLAAFLGLFLAFLFLQLFQMALNLLATALGAQAYTRGRKLVLLLLLLAVAGILFEAARTAGPGGRPGFGPIERTDLWRTLSAPLRWFVEVFLTEPGAWEDLLLYTALSGGVILVLLAIILLLDVHYLESAAVTSEKIYTRLQRMRRGEAGAGWRESSGEVRLGLPDFPWWGGVGPIAWRQATTAFRSLGRLALFALIMGPILVGPMMAGNAEPGDGGGSYAVSGLLLWMTIIMTTLVPYDFRGDLERMEVLKTLPLPPWRVALGQLVTPVLLISLVQALFLGAIQLVWGRWDLLLLTVLALAVPLNLLVFGLDNLLFLWFPSRVLAANPGDFQALGRNVLLLLTKVMVLIVAGSLSAGVWFVVSEVLGFRVAGLLSAWLTLTAFALALVPLLALAFDSFDVARDMPA
ncbi:MAG: hypothetical protein HYS12_25095 [Planctomycetes bacterium]|nr:hypothetical protein [Planctomycetota bacterium]